MDQIVIQFSDSTNLKPEFARYVFFLMSARSLSFRKTTKKRSRTQPKPNRQCLEQSGWSLEQAYQNFTQAKVQSNIFFQQSIVVCLVFNDNNPTMNYWTKIEH